MKITAITTFEDQKNAIGFAFNQKQYQEILDLRRRFQHLAIGILHPAHYHSLMNLFDRLDGRCKHIDIDNPASLVDGNTLEAIKLQEGLYVFVVFFDELMELYDHAFQVIMGASEKIVEMTMDQEIEDHFIDCM